MNLIECFQPNLVGNREALALQFAGRRFTFGELHARSDALACALKSTYGIQKGDRLAMYLGNGLELILFYLAGLKLGAIMVPMNVLYRDRELTHLLDDAQPRLILTDAERFKVLAPLVPSFSFIENVVVTDERDPDGERIVAFADLEAKGGGEPFAMPNLGGDDPAMMIYTSGTTGRSKGALLTHGNLTSNIITLLHCWRWTGADRFLLALPLFHLHGLGNGLHGWLASGCMTFLLPRFKADAVLKMMNQKAITLFFGVPTMYERLLEAVEGGSPVPKSLRLFVSGSAPLSPDTFVRFKQAFGHEILERYGMSETAMITSNLYSGPRVQGTVGKPLPGVSVRMVKEDGTPVEGDEVGEVQVKGPNVLKEYWRQPEKTAESFTADGWFKTGDLGRFDEGGRVALVGRGKDLIISGGFNIYPKEIENLLTDHPAVSEAVAIGVPDQRRGELVKGYVVCPAGSVTEEELIAYCKEHLASFKVPRRFVFIDKLPRNAMGKVQRQDLPERDRM